MSLAKSILSGSLCLALTIGLAPSVAVAQDSTGNNGDIPEISAVQRDPSNLAENSWRYSNGELIVDDTETLIAPQAAFQPWSLTDKGYISSNGSVIQGAVSKGIDVSEHNGTIDWESVKADGIDFAIIRCGYGSDYSDQDDPFWEYNVSECERLDIPYGVYLYSYAMDNEDAASEAEHVLRLLQGYSPTFPIYYDLEESVHANAESRELLASMAKTFTDRISNAGYKVGIYANLYWFNNFLTDPIFDSWERWVAQYNYQCDYEKSYGLWQSTSSGSVLGINGAVDINFQIKPLPDDVDKNDWYVTSGVFTYAITHKLMTVYSNSNAFGPYDNISRGQVATILWRMAGQPIVNAPHFEDVDYSQYYGSAISWARSTGVINGYKSNSGSGEYTHFGPDDSVTREQLAVMLANYASKVGGVNTASDMSLLDSMPDAFAVSTWARPSLGWAMDAGLISGVKTSGTALVDPQGNAWRCAMAKMVTVLDGTIL